MGKPLVKKHKRIAQAAKKIGFFLRNGRYLFGNETFRRHHSAMALVDNNGRIIRINRELAKFPNFVKAKRSDRIFDFILKEDRREVQKAMKKALKTRKIQEVAFKHSHISENGKPVIIDFVIHPKNGRLLEISWRNITNVAEQLATEQKLSHQKQRNIELGELTGQITHDIGNPAATISGLNELMAEELAKKKPNMRKIKEYNKAYQRAEEQLRELLDVLRVHRVDPTQIKRENIKPINLLNMTRTQSRLIEREFGIKFQYIGSKELPQVNVNAAELNSVLANCITNASDVLRKTKNGKIVLKVQKTKNGQNIIFSISDNGSGIKPRIFDAINKGKQITTKGETGGSGKGIPGMKETIRNHGGEFRIITTVSTPQKRTKQTGTKVSFILPIIH